LFHFYPLFVFVFVFRLDLFLRFRFFRAVRFVEIPSVLCHKQSILDAFSDLHFSFALCNGLYLQEHSSFHYVSLKRQQAISIRCALQPNQ